MADEPDPPKPPPGPSLKRLALRLSAAEEARRQALYNAAVLDLLRDAETANTAAQTAATKLEAIGVSGLVEQVTKAAGIAQVEAARAFGASMTAAAALLSQAVGELQRSSDIQGSRLGTWTRNLFWATAALAFATLVLAGIEYIRGQEAPVVVNVSAPAPFQR